MTAELVLRWSDGSLDLMGWNDSDHGEFEIRALANGTDWGNPESVRRVLRSALLDGSTSVKERDDNRTIPLRLQVSAPSGGSLAGGEKALALLDGRRCELVWTPPDALAAPAVFVVISATLRHEMNDLEELASRRYYTLTLDCLPHAYSDEYVTIPAIVQGESTPVLIHDCSNLTGWSATNATLQVEGSRVVVTPPPMPIGTPYSGILTKAIDLTTDGYIAVEDYAMDYALAVRQSDGSWVTLSKVGRDGRDRIFDATGVADRTVEAIRFTWRYTGAYAQPIANIEKQATPRSIAARQQLRTLEVPGSARTPASLLVESPTTPLGTVILYTGPEYNPALSRGAVGGREVEPANLSGGYDFLAIAEDPLVYEIPASEFFEGDHSFWIRTQTPHSPGTTTGTLTLTVKLMSFDGATVSSHVVSSTAMSWMAADFYQMRLIGSATLPPASLPKGSLAVVRFELGWSSPQGHDIRVDELLAFNRTLGRLGIAEVGDYRKMWADSATLESDRPTVYVADFGKAEAVPLNLTVELPSWPGAHVVEPPVTHLYTGATGAPDAEVSGTFRPAWFLHPAV